MVTGKEFRVSLRNGTRKQRLVPPFSQQSIQANTKVIAPPRIYIFRGKSFSQTLFRKYFDRGDLPIARAYNKASKPGQVLIWKLKPENLDYSHYLPIFFEGLAESELPYKLLARSGLADLLTIKDVGDKVLPVIPLLIVPIKNALNTRNEDVIKATLVSIQILLKTGPFIGKALVPYFRQILPIFNMMRNVNVNLGHRIDFNRDGHVGDKVEDTLQLLEKYGGDDAFINIKYIVPTYESCVLN